MIFNGVRIGRTDGYGVVLTADCDIAQSKIKYIHYLSITPLKKYFCSNFCNQIIIHEATEYCKNKKYDYKFIKMCLENGQDVDADEKAVRLTSFNADECSQIDCFLKESFRKIATNKIKEILTDRIWYLYFMDDVGNNDNNGYIIDFRDIRSLNIDVAKEISTGVIQDEPIDDYKKSGLSSNEGILMPTGIMESPLREHFMQRFSHNFVRIGLPDINKELAQNLMSNF